MTQQEWEQWLLYITGQSSTPPGSYTPGTNPLEVMTGS